MTLTRVIILISFGLGLFSLNHLCGQSIARINTLQIVSSDGKEVEFDNLASSFRDKQFTAETNSRIRQNILDILREQGHFFAKIDSFRQNPAADSAPGQTRAVNLVYYVSPDKPLILRTVSLTGLESLTPPLAATLDEIAAGHAGRIYNQILLDGLSRSLMTELENNAYPLAKFKTDRFQVSAANEQNNLDLNIHIMPGDSVSISYLKFPQTKMGLAPYLQRILRFTPESGYRESRISTFQQILQREEFMRSVDSPVLARDDSGRHYLRINFEEAPGMTFDGIVGYVPPPSNDVNAEGFFTGQINIGVRNLFGGGRKLQIFWQKQDQLSDEFRLAFREPFVFSLPFHTEFGMNRLLRDTTYLEWRYRVKIDLPLNEYLTAFGNLASRSVIPDSLASRRQRLPRTSAIETESGLDWDIRDKRGNPTKGLQLIVAFNIARQQNKGPDYLLAEDSLRSEVSLRRIRADLDLFFPLFNRQVLANHAHLEFIENSGEALRVTDQVYFGGATTVRGFREAQFFAKRVFWLNTEYRFLLGPESRFFLFTDNAYYSREAPDKRSEWLTSFGLGLRFPVPLGIMQFDYGLEKGAPFQEGKLHFRLINEF